MIASVATLPSRSPGAALCCTAHHDFVPLGFTRIQTLPVRMPPGFCILHLFYRSAMTLSPRFHGMRRLRQTQRPLPH